MTLSQFYSASMAMVRMQRQGLRHMIIAARAAQAKDSEYKKLMQELE